MESKEKDRVVMKNRGILNRWNRIEDEENKKSMDKRE